jgi:hypothetical protein
MITNILLPSPFFLEEEEEEETSGRTPLAFWDSTRKGLSYLLKVADIMLYRRAN